MDRVSNIRLDSLEEYEANIEAELYAVKALQTHTAQLSQQTQRANKAEPEGQRRQAEPVQAAVKPEGDELIQPLDIVDIRGRIQTIQDLSPRPPVRQRFDIWI